MVVLCREKAAREGLSPTLFVQAMHELDPPRRYKTIFVCGAFGLGSTREQDVQALLRFHDNLEPDGTLVLDRGPVRRRHAVAVLVEGQARGASGSRRAA